MPLKFKKIKQKEANVKNPKIIVSTTFFNFGQTYYPFRKIAQKQQYLKKRFLIL